MFIYFKLQSISKTGGLKSNNPSISITPVPGGKGMALPGMLNFNFAILQFHEISQQILYLKLFLFF